MTTQLASPQIVVLIETPGTDDLTEYTIQTDNRDAIQWDVTRAKRGWPKATDGAILWLSFLAWHALHRTGVYPGPLDDFLKVTVEVKGVTKDGSAVGVGQLDQEDLAPLEVTPQGVGTGL